MLYCLLDVTIRTIFTFNKVRTLPIEANAVYHARKGNFGYFLVTGSKLRYIFRRGSIFFYLLSMGDLESCPVWSGGIFVRRETV